MKNLYNLRVAKIIDDYRVVLNAGSEDGVTVGMTFVVFEEGDEIIDPEDGSSLGRLEVTKGRVKAFHVQEKFCSAASDTKVTRTIGGNTREYMRDLQSPKVGDRAKRAS